MLKIIGLFIAAGAVFLGFGKGLTAYYTPVAKPPVVVAAAQGPQAVSIAADASGHFSTDVRINGQFVKGLVDTGATIIALPGDVAQKIGLNPPLSSYTTPIQTANGTVNAARVKLSEVRIGSIVVRDVEGVVVPQGLHVTLVGMSFFNRLQSFEMRGKTLVLRQ